MELGLEERMRAKEIKKHNYIDKILVDTIGMPSIDHVTFII
jgi:flagellar biosynthesis GTPase FlhF